ncbi:MAG: efflux RND transporter periplasmic adaptor subunit [Isosphaeraceae bacterium]
MTDANQNKRNANFGRMVIGSGLVLALVAAAWIGVQGRYSGAVDLEGFPRSVVRRTDLHVTLVAGGLVESAKKTLIECELQNLRFSSHGQSIQAGGHSTILELIPDGSTVHRDDVLCRMDSSDYEELVRQQEIKVQEAQSGKRKAELDLQAAELGLMEYREGTLSTLDKDFRGKITLAEVDLKRLTDRVAWAHEMVGIGYLSPGQLSTEEQSLMRVEVSLAQFRGNYQNLKTYGGPINIQQLESLVEKAKAELNYQGLRLARQEDQLTNFQEQVDLCTVKAPHDGFVIYANRPDRDPRILLGATVTQKMDLFYLPDLSEMEIQTQLNETVVGRVRNGMTARVRVEGLSKYALEGHVVGISRLPVSTSSWTGTQVRNYVGRIKLHTIPDGLLPGMTAEVEILTDQRTEALVVPCDALAIEHGREICYVARPNGLERREVKTGQSTRDLLEIIEGLAEGEEVVLDPAQVRGTALVADASTRESTSIEESALLGY